MDATSNVGFSLCVEEDKASHHCFEGGKKWVTTNKIDCLEYLPVSEGS